MKKITLTIFGAIVLAFFASISTSCKKDDPVANFTMSADSVWLDYGCGSCKEKATSEYPTFVTLTNTSENADSYIWTFPNGDTIQTTNKAPFQVSFNYYDGYNAAIYNDCNWNSANISLKAVKGKKSSTKSTTFKLNGCD